MEWRAFLAITLSILVLVVFQAFFAKYQGKPHETPPPPKAANTTEQGKDVGPASVASTGPTSTEEANSVNSTSLAAPTVTQGHIMREAKDVVLETDLYRAVFTEEGGAIKAFYLKKYHESVEKDSPLVNVVNSIPPLYPLASGTMGRRGGIGGFVPIYMKAHRGEGAISFTATLQGGAVLKKVYTLSKDSYWVDLTISLEGPKNGPVPGLLLANKPILESTSYSFQGISLLGVDGYTEITLKEGETEKYSGKLTWIGIGDKYFMATLVPLSKWVNGWDIAMKKVNGDGLVSIFIRPNIVDGILTSRPLKLGVFIGPKEIDTLKAVDHELVQTINFGWFDIVAKPLLYFLKFIYRFTHNYGIAIIILTILIKIAFWPLAHKSAKAMKTMQKIQPKLQKLKEKYGDDKERLNKELLQIYKTYKVNPMSGCLPMLLQIPVFFALYKVLLQAIELRHAPFMLWINDLSAPDRLMIPGVDIPMVHGIPVLTILMGVSMWWQQKMTPASLDPTQAKMMQFLPVIFTFMFVTFPSGLVLYWLVNNVLSVAQQYYINKFTD